MCAILQKIDGLRVPPTYLHLRSRYQFVTRLLPYYQIINNIFSSSTPFATLDTMSVNMQQVENDTLPILYKDQMVQVSHALLVGMDGNKVRKFAKSLQIDLPTSRDGTPESRKAFLAKAIMTHLKNERERRDNAENESSDDDDGDDEAPLPPRAAMRVRSPSPVARKVVHEEAGDLEASLNAFDVPALKDMLRAFDLRISGIKEDLIARLIKAWKNEPPMEGIASFLNSERLIMATRKLSVKEAKAKIKRESDSRRSRSRTPMP